MLKSIIRNAHEALKDTNLTWVERDYYICTYNRAVRELEEVYNIGTYESPTGGKIIFYEL